MKVVVCDWALDGLEGGRWTLGPTGDEKNSFLSPRAGEIHVGVGTSSNPGLGGR